MLAEDRRSILKTRGGSGTEASKHGLRRHLGVSRHMPGKDSEDTWASEGTFPAKTLLGAKTWASKEISRAQSPCQGTYRSEAMCLQEDSCPRQVGRRHASSQRHVGVRRHVPKTGRARTRVVVKTHGRAKTLPEDRFGEDAHRREDTWAREEPCKTGRRRHAGARRHFPKTGWVKTRFVAKTCAREDTSRRQVGRTRPTWRRHVGDTSSGGSRNRERQCVLNCRDVFSVAASYMQVHAYSAVHDSTAT